jgi:two-component system, sensor histidine kinase
VRFLPNIRYGTERYPERVPRRRRVVSLMAWFGFVFAAGWGVTQFLDPTPGMWKAASVNAIAAVTFVSVPLLLRIAPTLPVLIALSIFNNVYLFIIIYLFGTGSGVSMYYLVLAGLAVATFGTERILLSAFFGLMSAALIVASEALVPRSTGLYSATGGFASFAAVSVATTALLMATVYYALRTAERAEEALAHDNEIIQDKTRQLEIANKYKSHFLASASHDLRQPLHALNLFVAQLQDESNPAERSRLVGRIEAAVSSMNELFGSLLDMTKLDAGILEPSVTEFPIGRLFGRIETTFTEVARAKGVRLRAVSTRMSIRSDAILLERMLMNLVSNAVRYTQHGGVVVGCRRRGNELRIDVCDTGPGIPEEQQRKIFAEFYQYAAPEADRRGSLGLGLAIVDRLGRLLGHAVELYSRPGRGSRFSISVPIAAERGRGAVPTISPAAVVDPVRGKLVVVIDDDPLVLEGMGGILRSWGCNVVSCDSSEAALSKVELEAREPDIIISDYRLGSGKTGIQAIEQLRQSFGAEIPAFLISGDTAPERLRDASENGLHLLHKPVPPMRLRAMLNQLLRARPVTIATAAQ